MKHTRHPWKRGYHRHRTARPHKQRFLFRRFIAALGCIWLFFMVALLVLLALVFVNIGATRGDLGLLLWISCGVPLGFTVLFFIFGGWMFRRIGRPLVEVMAAADAVAEGDLDVRVREDAPGEFGGLARSFNRMTKELGRAEQQRRNLTADVAHELRTPLHIIQGNLEGILDGVYQPDEAHISATLEETQLLSRLVNDLNTLSLAESGELPLHRQHVSAADLLSDVATSFSAQVEGAGVELILDVTDEGNSLVVDVDPGRMDQVLSNLVANALRHTFAGGKIILAAKAIPDGVQMMVQDTGAGISQEDLPFVFDRFWRGERSRTRGVGAGSGLGLAIARQLVQAHEGQIDVESQIGVGTIFTIRLYTSPQ